MIKIERKSFKYFFIALLFQYILFFLFSDELTLRRTELFVFSSASVLLNSYITNKKQYFFNFSLISTIFISILFLKINLLNEVLRSYEIIRYITFSCCFSNLIISFDLLFNNCKKYTIIKCFIIFVFSLPIVLVWMYYFVSGAWLNVDAILAILQTNFNEAKEYANDNFSVYHVMFLCLYIIFIFILKNKILFNKHKGFVLLFLSIFLSLIGIQKANENILLPIFIKTKEYIQYYNNFDKYKLERKDNLLKLVENTKDIKGVFVLVIGESQNKNYMSAYGYSRNSTPWLNKIKDNYNVIFFKNAYSCHTHTIPVLTYALTEKNQYNNINFGKANSLVEVVEAVGCETVWLSNQSKYGIYDTPITVIASEANQQIWINNYEGEGTKANYYDLKLIEELNKIKYTDKMFIVIHLMGNHGSYDERYPDEFKKFIGGKDVDEYDNSILYNDYVVQNLYKKLSTLPDFKCMVYFADHADVPREHLGHDVNRYIPEMTEIPFYMLLSESYIKENQEKFNSLKIAQDKYFTNDLIFNTVLSLMNIKINGMYEAENDISSQQYDSNPERFRTLYGKKRIGEQ